MMTLYKIGYSQCDIHKLEYFLKDNWNDHFVQNFNISNSWKCNIYIFHCQLGEFCVNCVYWFFCRPKEHSQKDTKHKETEKQQLEEELNRLRNEADKLYEEYKKLRHSDETVQETTTAQGANEDEKRISLSWIKPLIGYRFCHFMSCTCKRSIERNVVFNVQCKFTNTPQCKSNLHKNAIKRSITQRLWTD